MSAIATRPATPETPSQELPRNVVGRSSRALLVLIVALLALITWQVWSIAGGSDEPGVADAAEIDQSAFVAETGGFIEYVALTGGNGILEIRYRIVDGQKAEIFHDLDNPPRLEAGDGYVLDFERHEHPHDFEFLVASSYNSQLMNIGGIVERGDKVSVWVGTTELRGVTVQ
jgi:hypothetical protein